MKKGSSLAAPSTITVIEKPQSKISDGDGDGDGDWNRTPVQSWYVSTYQAIRAQTMNLSLSYVTQFHVIRWEGRYKRTLCKL
jgi:hypothetical protein